MTAADGGAAEKRRSRSRRGERHERDKTKSSERPQLYKWAYSRSNVTNILDINIFTRSRTSPFLARLGVWHLQGYGDRKGRIMEQADLQS